MAEKGKKLEGLNILLGVSGGIAAYKAVDLASKLRQMGAAIQTVMTESACKLVGPKSFEAVSGGKVFTSLWSEWEEYQIGHVELDRWADIVVVAPATANIIAKAAQGICDEILSTTLCVCFKKPVIIAPAMNGNMWDNPAVQRNMAVMKEMGFEIVGPGKGWLACGEEATGRMAEPAEIIEAVEKLASKIKHKKK